MIITFSGHNIIKKLKLYFRIIILAIILFYILPKLLSLLWYMHYPKPKMHEEPLWEKPLRVTASVLKIS
jgi:hypothetical protein